jgi:Sec-independent protein secretion pathway component TatC
MIFSGRRRALVLGVWGIHGILTPQNLYYLTAVDLALSMVIIFLLGAITVRAFLYIHDRGGLGWFGGRRR